MPHTITFHPSGRGKARCEPNPEFPNGIVIPRTGADWHCLVKLPYPAPECGHHRVECSECGMTMAITAAGRPDDPISVQVPCLSRGPESKH
jgi:hypothetical protein